MPSPSYQQNKKHIYRWVENNLERKREIARNNQRKYDMWKREKKIFLKILLE